LNQIKQWRFPNKSRISFVVTNCSEWRSVWFRSREVSTQWSSFNFVLLS